MKLNLKVPLCFFDLETTGTNISQDRIIEIAVIKVLPSGEMKRKTNLVNPTIPITAESTAIHGIDNDDVKATLRKFVFLRQLTLTAHREIVLFSCRRSGDRLS